MSRGRHPEDAEAFAPTRVMVLRRAAEEVCWLLERGYSMTTAVHAVGNHHQLRERQRVALTRCCAAPTAVRARLARRAACETMRARAVHVDAFNLIVSLEVALGGGPLLRGRDGALRDLAGLRGSYHVLESTRTAITLAHRVLAAHEPESVDWWIDAPVSNSGRLRALLEDLGAAHAWMTRTQLVADADSRLFGMPHVVSADALVLDRSASWHDLASLVVSSQIPEAWVVSLEQDAPGAA